LLHSIQLLLLLVLWRGLLLLLYHLLLLARRFRAHAAAHCAHDSVLLLLQLMQPTLRHMHLVPHGAAGLA
jgi:hypothetical protein